MSGNVKILSIVLVLQIALSAWIYTGQQELSAYEAKKELLSLSNNDVNFLELLEVVKDDKTSKTEEKTLVLNKKGSVWNVKISDDFTFKAQKSKVQNLLSSITRLKRPLPVATSKVSHKQLELAEDNFNKKISLKGKDREEVVLLGKSAGFKQVHVRKLGEDNSYSVDFDVYSLDFDPVNWIDKEFLVLDDSKIYNVNLPKLKLERKDNSFILSDDDKVKLDQNKVNSIFKALANLRIQAVVSNKKEGLKDLVNTVKFKYENEDKEYSFYVNSDEEYNLTVKGMPYIFTVAKAPIDKLLAYKKDELLKVEKSEASKN